MNPRVTFLGCVIIYSEASNPGRDIWAKALNPRWDMSWNKTERLLHRKILWRCERFTSESPHIPAGLFFNTRTQRLRGPALPQSFCATRPAGNARRSAATDSQHCRAARAKPSPLSSDEYIDHWCIIDEHNSYATFGGLFSAVSNACNAFMQCVKCNAKLCFQHFQYLHNYLLQYTIRQNSSMMRISIKASLKKSLSNIICVQFAT